MENKIIASFNSIDAATHAVHDIKVRYERVHDIKIRHEPIHRSTSLLASPFFAPTDTTMPVMQNGIMPIPLTGIVAHETSGIPKSDDIYEPHRATVYMVVDSTDAGNISAALATHGGYSIKVR